MDETMTTTHPPHAASPDAGSPCHGCAEPDPDATPAASRLMADGAVSGRIEGSGAG